MRETNFIRQNKDKWVEFEKHLASDKKDPDKLSNLFVQVTDDLSYSRTFYPNRSVRVYLNNISQKVFQKVYRNRSNKRRRFAEFWKDELPAIIYESRKELILSFILFWSAFFIGVFSCIQNPEFPRMILGDRYVDMTIANIQSGDPMAVYKAGQQGTMFLQITFNNLLVDLITFVSGIFYSIGTLGAVVYNGIMVGAFQYFFYQHDVFQESFFAIWLHGTLEISTIILAGGAGLTLGKGLVFPGTYSRLQAFRITARRGLKIMVGVAPITVFAAIIESFLTRYTGVPDWVRGILILVSLTFVIGYFVVYPIRRAKKGIRQAEGDSRLSAALNTQLEFDTVKTTGEVFRDIFIVMKKNFRLIFWPAFFMSLGYAVYAAHYFSDLLEFKFHLRHNMVENTFRFFYDLFHNWLNYERFPEFIVPNVIMFSIMAFLASYFLHKASDPRNVKMSFRYLLRNAFKPFIVGGAITLTLYLPDGWGVFFFFVLLPCYLTWLFAFHCEGKFFASFGKGFGYGFGLFGRSYGLYLILLLVTFLFMSIIASQYITWKVFEIINWNIRLEDAMYLKFYAGFYSFISFLGLNLILCMFVIGNGLLCFSGNEIRSASALREKIKSIGKKKNNRENLHAA